MDEPDGRKIPHRMLVPLPLFTPKTPHTIGPMLLLQKTGLVNRSNRDSTSEQASEDDPLANYEPKYTWEYSLLLQVGPDDVRREVDIVISDLIVRLKQLLFNSLFCAYYVGFIPMQFADVSYGNGTVV